MKTYKDFLDESAVEAGYSDWNECFIVMQDIYVLPELAERMSSLYEDAGRKFAIHLKLNECLQ